ncbi:MAG: YfiR family protein [Anaerohalosphaeraceae bacterium]
MKRGNNIEVLNKTDRAISGAGQFVVLICIVLANITQFLSSAAIAATDADIASTGYQLKVTFLYNFMKFMDWPDPNSVSNTDAKDKDPVVLGVLGDNYLKKNMQYLTGKTIKNRPLKAITIEGYNAYKQEKNNATVMDYLTEHQNILKSCHLLFISASEKDRLAEILKFTEKNPILTVSDIRDFVEAGGVIGFVTENNRIRFDINTVSAETKRLKISSQLLQLARKIFKKQTDKQGQ